MSLRVRVYCRDVRGQLLHTEYKANLDGSFNQCTTTQPLHRYMRDELASNPSADTLSGEFISKVGARITGAKTGNLYSETLYSDIAMLGWSLKSVGSLQPEQVAKPSLLDRVVAELANRSTDEISASDAPPAIWVDREHPEIQQRLVHCSIVTLKTVRAAALLAAAKRGEGAAPKLLVTKKPQDKFGRFVIKLLRHTAVQYGLPMRSDGYVAIKHVMEIDIISKNTVKELLQIVAEDKKMRCSVIEEDNCLYIRANQGHTIPCVRDALLMTPITDPAKVPVCVHGTYESAWEAIQDTALDRMGRNAISMAVGLPGNPDVKSGIRTYMEVLIYIDVTRAMAAGIPFFRSVNNVICSPGPIPPKFFARVVRRTDNKILYEQSCEEAPDAAAAAEGEATEAAVAAEGEAQEAAAAAEAEAPEAAVAAEAEAPEAAVAAEGAAQEAAAAPEGEASQLSPLQQLFQDLKITEELAIKFEKEEICTTSLKMLTPEDLKKLGCRMGPQKKLLNWIAKNQNPLA